MLFNFILFLTLYLFGPSVRRRISQIWVGALVAAVLWEESKYLFASYVTSFSPYRMLYGTIGSVIALLLWLYLSGTLFALGAEVNSVLGMRRDRHPPATH
jgi:membrane protein